MINKNTMWKIITVTMVALATAILVTAIGGGAMLIKEFIPVGDIADNDGGADKKAPTLTSDSDTIIIYTGSTLSYRKFVKITDNGDGECKLEATKSTVNQNVPGEYSVTLVATDAAGNKSKALTLKVVVKDKMYSEESLMTLIAQKAKAERQGRVILAEPQDHDEEPGDLQRQRRDDDGHAAEEGLEDSLHRAHRRFTLSRSPTLPKPRAFE